RVDAVSGLNEPKRLMADALVVLLFPLRVIDGNADQGDATVFNRVSSIGVNGKCMKEQSRFVRLSADRHNVQRLIERQVDVDVKVTSLGEFAAIKSEDIERRFRFQVVHIGNLDW